MSTQRNPRIWYCLTLLGGLKTCWTTASVMILQPNLLRRHSRNGQTTREKEIDSLFSTWFGNLLKRKMRKEWDHVRLQITLDIRQAKSLTFNRFVCQDFIERAKVNSKLAWIVPWKPKTVSALKGLLCNAQSRLLRHLKTVGVLFEDKPCDMSWAGAIHWFF